jgi:hypothetical protein
MPRLLGRGTTKHENRPNQRVVSKSIFVLKSTIQRIMPLIDS